MKKNSESLLIKNKAEKVTLQDYVSRAFDQKNGRIDVLFIYPPMSIQSRYGKEDIGDLGGDLIPMGIGYLAAFLRENGFGVGCLDCCALHIGHDELIEIIKERDPHVIGITATTYALPSSVKLAERIRTELSGKLVVLGGAHSNAVPGHAIESYPCFDIEAFGADGEYTTLDLIEKYARKGFKRDDFLEELDLLSNIKGIVFRDDNGKPVKSEPRPPISDLDGLPFPARDLFPMERYIPLPNQYKRLPIANMIFIRGCPYSCTFCDQAKMAARKPSPERAIQEVKHVVEQYGVREISFWDDTMSYNKNWMRQFCEHLIDANLGLIWSCYAAINTVDESILKLMKKAGCWNVFYGYETGVPELLENIKAKRKNHSLERMLEVTKWTKKAGIEIRGSFMLAMPGETPELAKQTIKNAIKLNPEYAQFSITTPYPGTELYDEIQEGKWGEFTTSDFAEFQGWNVVFLPEGYNSKEEVMAIEREAFRSFYFRISYILKKVLAIRTFEDIKRYWKGGLALLSGFAFGPMPDHVRVKTGRNPQTMEN